MITGLFLLSGICLIGVQKNKIKQIITTFVKYVLVALM
jgi:hypothetical protein